MQDSESPKSFILGIDRADEVYPDKRLRSGFYAIQFPHGVKIGMSNDVPNRVKSVIQHGKAYSQLVASDVLMSIPHSNCSQNEAKLHRIFSAKRIAGEIFAVSLEDVRIAAEGLLFTPQKHQDPTLIGNPIKGIVDRLIEMEEEKQARESEHPMITDLKTIERMMGEMADLDDWYKEREGNLPEPIKSLAEDAHEHWISLYCLWEWHLEFLHKLKIPGIESTEDGE